MVTIHLTERCDCRCPSCHVTASRRMYQRTADDELPFGLLERVAQECAAHAPLIRFLGGEPTLHSRFLEIGTLYTGRGLECSTTTNGCRLAALAQGLVASGLQHVNVSLDGWDEPSQFERVRVAGTFERIAAGIRGLLAARGGRRAPAVRVSTVINRTNFAHLERMLEVVVSLGPDRWRLTHHSFVTPEALARSRGYALETGIGACVTGARPARLPLFAPDELQVLEAQIDAVRRAATGRIAVELQNTALDLRDYYSERAPGPGSRCLTTDAIEIRGDGSVVVCVGGFRLGHLREHTLAELWTGDRMAYYRETLARDMPLPMCFRCCALAPSFSNPTAKRHAIETPP